MVKAYTDYGTYLKRFFDFKVQKISINAGYTCPNRDGSKGTGGCIYCNNSSFSTVATNRRSVTEQLEDGKRFFAHKYPSMKYLAYFQAYTSTYGDIDRLLAQYHEALRVPDVVGLVIGTRPDMVPDTLLDSLAEIARSKYVMIEYGAESAHDATLQLVNRCHTWNDVVDAVNRTRRHGIHCCLHLIMGLPGETTSMMLETISNACTLKPDVLKLHQLQILKNTPLAAKVSSGDIKVTPFDINEYLRLCREIINLVPREIAIERFTSSAPPEMVIAPRWGIKNYQFTQML